MSQASLAVCSSIKNIRWSALPALSCIKIGQISEVYYGVSFEDNVLTFISLKYNEEEDQIPMKIRKIVNLELNSTIVDVCWKAYINLDKYPFGLLLCLLKNELVVYDPFKILASFCEQVKINGNKALKPEGVKCASNFGIILSAPINDDISVMEFDEVFSDRIVLGCDNGDVLISELGLLIENLDTATENMHNCWTRINTNIGKINSFAWHCQKNSKDILAVGGKQGIVILHTLQKKILMCIESDSFRKDIVGVYWLENGNNIAVIYGEDHGMMHLWDLKKKQPYKQIKLTENDKLMYLEKSYIDPRFFLTVSNMGSLTIFGCQTSKIFIYAQFNLGKEIKKAHLLRSSNFLSIETDNEILIYSIESFVLNNEHKFAPFWVKLTDSITRSFGGKVVSLSNKNGTSILSKYKCTTEDPTLVTEVEEFKQFYSQSNLLDYCKERVKKAEIRNDPVTAQLWNLFSCNFVPIEQQITSLLDALGYNQSIIINTAENALSNTNFRFSAQNNYNINTFDQNQTKDNSEGDASTFFAQLANSNQDNDEKLDPLPTKLSNEKDKLILSREWNCEPLKLLKETLIVGQTNLAIDLAYLSKDFGLAFFLASLNRDSTILQALLHKFLEFHNLDILKIIHGISEDQFIEQIDTINLENWKEIVACLINYQLNRNTTDAFTQFNKACNLLANKFLEQGDIVKSVFCFIIGRNHDEVIKNVTRIPTNDEYDRAMLILCVKTLISTSHLDQRAFDLIYKLVTALVDCGCFSHCMSILNLISDLPNVDRLYAMIEESQGIVNKNFSLTIYEIGQASESVNLKNKEQYTQYAMNSNSTGLPLPNNQSNRKYNMMENSNNPPDNYQKLTYSNVPSNNQNVVSNSMNHNFHGNVIHSFNEVLNPYDRNNLVSKHNEITNKMYNPVADKFPNHNMNTFQQINQMPKSYNINYPNVPPAKMYNDKYPNFSNLNEFHGDPRMPLPRLKLDNELHFNQFNDKNQKMSVDPNFQTNNYSDYLNKSAISNNEIWQKSTHPAAGIGVLPPEAPTPWPIPTTAQQSASRSNIIAKKTDWMDKVVTKPNFVPCENYLVSRIDSNLKICINRMPADKKANLLLSSNQLIEAIKMGAYNCEIYELIDKLCKSIVDCEGDIAQTTVQNLIDVAWSKETKIWITMFKQMIKVLNSNNESHNISNNDSKRTNLDFNENKNDIDLRGLKQPPRFDLKNTDFNNNMLNKSGVGNYRVGGIIQAQPPELKEQNQNLDRRHEKSLTNSKYLPQNYNTNPTQVNPPFDQSMLRLPPGVYDNFSNENKQFNVKPPTNYSPSLYPSSSGMPFAPTPNYNYEPVQSPNHFMQPKVPHQANRFNSKEFMPPNNSFNPGNFYPNMPPLTKSTASNFDNHPSNPTYHKK